MRQYAGFGTAAESNARYHAAARARHRRACRSPSTCRPRWATTPTPPIAHGEVGKVGVAIDSIDDMRMLFDGIPLDKVSTSMTINAPAALLLLLYQLVAEEQGVPGATADRHDPERRAQGVHRPRHLHLPAEAVAAADHRHLRLLPGRDPALEHDLDLRLPHGRGRGDARAGDRVHPRQRHRVRPGGAAAGLDVDDFAPRLSFFFVARTTLLEEVAKFRAARRIWARVMRDEFGAKNPKSLMLRFHTQTAGVQLTAQQPEVNLVRVACRRSPRCSAAPSRCTPTPTTRRSRCRPRRRPGWRCAPSRCSPTRPT